jgi:HPt (histidine-containing phosphotransfer) domain-containing protein
MAAALRNCGEDETLRRDVTAELLRTLPGEVGSLRLAVEGGDEAAVARVAHRVKSSLAAVGAIPASDAARVLEHAVRQGDGGMAALADRFLCELERALPVLEASLRHEPVA